MLYRCHHRDPFIVIDHPVSINISVENHFIYFMLLHLLPQV